MGVYKRSIITEAGNQVLAKVVAGELALNFSHARTSSYAYAEGTDYTKLTSLQEVKQEIIPSNVKVINDTTVSVRLLFGNESISSTYLIQNIGLYVMDGDEERLFSVSAAIQPDQMPAYDGVAPSSFIYNVSLPVSQAESMTLQISPAGTATTEDILELEADIQGMEESKVTGTGGSISGTKTAVEEPTSATDKYPEIQASGGTTKTIFGLLARWVKSLKADKVDASGGDIKDTKVSEFTASTTQWPVPAAGEAPKTLWGKVKKFCEDFKTWSAGVCLLAQLVSNTTTNNANLPASAAAVYQLAQAMLGYAPKAHASSATTYGAGNASNFGHVKLSDNYTSSAGAAANGVAASSKALADAYSVLNTNKSETGHTHDERYYTEAEVNQFLNLLLVELSSTRSPLTRGTTNDCLQITLEGFLYSVNPSTLNLPVSGLYGLLVVFRIQDWRCHIILPTNNSSIYVDRYENTKWTGWRVISTATV